MITFILVVALIFVLWYMFSLVAPEKTGMCCKCGVPIDVLSTAPDYLCGSVQNEK